MKSQTALCICLLSITMGNILTRTKIINKPVLFVPEDYIGYLKENTTLSLGEIRHLYNRFTILSNGKKYLTKNDLMTMCGMQTNPVNTSIIYGLFGNRRRIYFNEFAVYLHIFKAQSDQINKPKRVQQKLQLLYNMYDRNKTGTITKDELFDVVHRMYCDQLDYAEILKIADIVMMETNPTGKDQILFEDFCGSLATYDIDSKLMLKIPEI